MEYFLANIDIKCRDMAYGSHLKGIEEIAVEV